jgi:hypothetical protein
MSRHETAIRIRAAAQDDLGILWDFLAIAAYEADIAAAKTVPFVAAHLEGWQRSEDFGFIAERDAEAIGAAWARQFFARRATGVLCRRPNPGSHDRGKRGCPRRGCRRKAAQRPLCRSGATRRRPVPECSARQPSPAPLRADRVSPGAGFRRSQSGRRHVVRHDLGRAAITANERPSPTSLRSAPSPAMQERGCKTHIL